MLLFVKQSPAGCTINVWDPKSDQKPSTLPLSTCPNHVFGIPEKNLILVTTQESIQEFELFPLQEKGAPLKLPTPPVNPKTSLVVFYAAGLTSGNLMTLITSSFLLGDETDNFVYVRRSGDWVLEKTVHCGRSGPCNLPTIRSNRDNLWPNQHKIWHPSQQENPFVVGRTERIEEDPYRIRLPTTVGQLAFSFKASRSVLTYRTMSGDLGGTLTFAIDLQINSEQPQVLAERQNETQLVGRYLLLKEFFGKDGGAELYDIETGQNVLGKLKLVEWLFADNQGLAP